MTPTPKIKKPPKAIASTQSLSSFVKSICDIMRRSNGARALQYVPELTWILFLRILDARRTQSPAWQAVRLHQQKPDASIALANVAMYGIDHPNRWHGHTVASAPGRLCAWTPEAASPS